MLANLRQNMLYCFYKEIVKNSRAAKDAAGGRITFVLIDVYDVCLRHLYSMCMMDID